MPRLTTTRAERATLPQSGQSFLWCSELVGFGVRLLPSGARSWVVRVRHLNKEVRLTLGAISALPFEGPDDHPGARDLARIAINAARRGVDPRIAIGRA